MNAFLKFPPMGWNSYDYYDTTVNEAQVRANAEFTAAHLKEFGWEFIVVDIAWYSKEAGKNRDKYQYVPFAEMEMDEYSRLMPDSDRFPSSADGKGFAPLAEYVHSLGLKFGIHIMRGIPRRAAYLRTGIKGTELTAKEVADPYSICAWNPDMYGVDVGSEGASAYYDSLMELYADWGVDLIKCDDICRMDAASSEREIELIREAIDKTGRNIVLSLSPGPAILDKHEFYRRNANMWRMTDDFWDSWESLRDMFNRCRDWQPYVTEGGYPDCDMLPIGILGKGFGDERKTNFTFDEQKTMLSLWCIFRSPLMIGGELTKLDDDTLSLLTNKSIYQMTKEITSSVEISRDDIFIIWKAESKNAEYKAVFNISEKEQDLPNIFETDGDMIELWSGKTMTQLKGTVIMPHGTMVFKLVR